MQMFTSCGWFFDEVSGIETLQILQYANRAIYYARQVSKVDLHEKFMDRLKAIPSNVYKNGAVAYEEFVVPARVDLERVGMHYAAASLFDRYPERLEFYNYIATSEVYERLIAGYQRFAVGRTTVKSKISSSEKHFSFAVLYLGQQTILGNISKSMDRVTFDEMHERTFAAFRATNISEVIGLTQEYFGPRQYSVWHLFRDEKRKILDEIVNKSIQQAENAYREIYGDNYQLMSGIKQSGMPIPKAYLSATQFILNKDLHRLFEVEDSFSLEELQRLQEEFKKWEVEKSDASTLKLAASEWIYRQLKLLQVFELNLDQLQELVTTLQVLKEMAVVPNFWKSQNLYFSMVKGYKSNEWVFANKDWEKAFFQLGDLLSVGL
ncbi:MAG: DUF3536 domain-containing protein, partial [Phaeodactylibacter sp.]|nr:DUF3536 domain-containing protein [Phaeodactylibacter sp.]